MADLVPVFVIEGEWKDTEPFPYSRGPRKHPFDPLTAYALVVDGRKLVFPDQENAEAFNRALPGSRAWLPPLPPWVKSHAG